jgi:transposase-like protein
MSRLAFELQADAMNPRAGALIAGVARERRLNANQFHLWIRQSLPKYRYHLMPPTARQP